MCTGVLPLWSSDLCTRQMMNLQCGATRLYRRNAVCRVEAPVSPAREAVLIPLKPWLQKRLRDGLTAVEIT